MTGKLATRGEPCLPEKLFSTHHSWIQGLSELRVKNKKATTSQKLFALLSSDPGSGSVQSRETQCVRARRLEEGARYFGNRALEGDKGPTPGPCTANLQVYH